VTFAIPEGAPPTSSGNEDNRVTWMLRATAALPESDFRCVFEVPVRQTGDADLLQPPVQLVQAQGAQAPDPMPALREDPSRGIVFDFQNSWNRATELVTVGYFLFWFQLIWLATSHQLGWETWGMFGAGMCFLGWAMNPWMSSTEVAIVGQEGTFKVTNRRFWMKRNTVVRLSELEDAVVKPSSLRTGLMDGLDFYHIELRRPNGKALTGGRHLRDRWQAGMIAHAFKTLIDRSR
jgi:hypothetical protein